MVLTTDAITEHEPPGVQRWTLYFTTPGEMLAFQDKLTRCCCTGVAGVVCNFTTVEFRALATPRMSSSFCGVLLPGLLTQDWVLSADECRTCAFWPLG
jgi:hypothetical protein